VDWLKAQGVYELHQVSARLVRGHMTLLQRRAPKDTTQHTHARGIKVLLNRRVRKEELEQSPICKVAMPRLERRVPTPFAAERARALLTAGNRKTVESGEGGAACCSTSS